MTWGTSGMEHRICWVTKTLWKRLNTKAFQLLWLIVHHILPVSQWNCQQLLVSSSSCVLRCRYAPNQVHTLRIFCLLWLRCTDDRVCVACFIPIRCGGLYVRRFYLAPKIEDEDMEGEGEAAEN